MKCSFCSKNVRYKQRITGRCPSCATRFAFEPKNERPKVTDLMFKHALDHLSDRGRLHFTPLHLVYEIDRRAHRWSWGRWLVATVGLSLGSLFLLGEVLGIFVLPVLAGLWVAIGTVALGSKHVSARLPRQVSDVDAIRLIAQWEAVRGTIPNLFRWDRNEAAPGSLDPELAAHGFERALVTDRAETAALLVRNEFHVDYACAVLSLDGYPFGVRDDLITALNASPGLRVMALHEASPTGCRLVPRLREAGWFPDPQIAVMDLGLRPTQARRLGLPHTWGPRAQLEPQVASMLTPDDLDLLESGHKYELAAFTPTRLISSIARGFRVLETIPPTESQGSGSTVWYIGDSGGADGEGDGDGDGGFG